MERSTYNSRYWTPLVRGSMCNGNQCAGFRNKETGDFEEICKIETPKDLSNFQFKYHLKRKDLQREW